jgi:hypothetical protein
MTNRFLISVAAAALIAGTGLANAQAPGRDAGSAGSAAQQSAPSGGGASSGAMQRDTGGTSGMKGGAESGMKGSEPGMKASETNDKAQPSSKSAQDGNRMQGEKSKSMHSETDSPKGGKDMKAEGRDSKSGDMNNAQTKGATDTKSGTAASETKSQTTGNAATSATAAPPPEKRTQINTAIRSEKIQETTNVNFNISVGTAVPASVHFHPLPPRIVEIYPEWRGYEVILVHGRYVIVRPQTREIVYIIEG